jgi:hypothetical protein
MNQRTQNKTTSSIPSKDNRSPAEKLAEAIGVKAESAPKAYYPGGEDSEKLN